MFHTHIIDKETKPVECMVIHKDINEQLFLMLFNIDGEYPFLLACPVELVEHRLSPTSNSLSFLQMICALKKAMKSMTQTSSFHNTYVKTVTTNCLEEICDLYAHELMTIKLVNRIKYTWLECLYNPEYEVCKRRLQKEYMCLVDEVGYHCVST
jgi:hypothetical protein